MKNKKPVSLLLVLALVMLVIPLTVVNAATGLDAELVTNGGAESSNLSGWNDDTGQGRWNSSTAYSDWALPAAGSKFFYLFNPMMDTPLSGTMSQEIVLSGTEGSGLFAGISAGNISMRFSISMYQNIRADNEVKAIIEEYAADGSLLKTSQVVNTTLSGTMGSYQINTQVNPGTRKFKVILSATLTKGGYAQFDQVSLKLVEASAGSSPVFGSDFPVSAETDAGVTYNANFSISDADDGDVNKLVFSASSTNTSLVPAASITVGGSGGNRTLTIVPAANLSGEADITVMVSDGTKSAEKTFHFIVHKVISLGTNLVENGDGTSGLDYWSGNTVNVTATGSGFRTNDPNSTMYQNVNISKFYSLIDGGETEFLMSSAFPNTYGKVSAQFYTDIACTNPVGSSFNINHTTASLQQKIPANAKSVKITFTNTCSAYQNIEVRNISFKIVNDFPKLSPIGAKTTNLSALTVPVYAYYTTANATLTASSNDQAIVPDSGITVEGTGFNRSITFTPLKQGIVRLTLTLNDGSCSRSTSFDVTVYDPTKVISVSSPTPGFYGAGASLDFTVAFNYPVTGGTSSTLPLTIGGTPAAASYLSSTADSITYRYTVSGSDSGVITIGSEIDDTGSPITDALGHDAQLEISAGATGVTVVKAPQVSTSAAGGEATYGTKITFTAKLNCAEPLSGTVQFKADGVNLGSPVAVSGNEASYETAETELDAGTVSITAVFVPNGLDCYFAGLTSSACTVTINPKPISVNGLIAAAKTYDGTSNVSLSGGTLNDVLPGDTVSAVYPTAGTAAQKNAGTHIVAFAPVVLTGADKDNYTLSAQPSVSAVISPKQMTASANISNKTYDGSTNAVVSSVVFYGLVVGESLTYGVDYTASSVFDSADVDTDIPVTVSVALADTEAAKNYVLSDEVGASASITQKAINICGVTATNRAYNGTTSVALTGGALTGVETADAGSVNFSLGTGNMTDAKAGNAKTVATNITLTGGKAGNYSLTQPTAITVDISKAALGLQSAVALNKVYDGSTNAAISSVVFDGLAAGESLTYGVDYTASGIFDSANVDTDIPVTVSVVLADTEVAKNYVASATGHAAADITPQVITGLVGIDVQNTTGQGGLIDEGDVLSVNTDSVAAPGALTVSCQWYRNDVAIPGATASSYTVRSLADDPAGTSLTVKITGTGNYTGTLESSAIEVIKIPLGGSVTMTGTAVKGQTLMLDTHLLMPAGAMYDVSWLRDGVAVEGAKSASYNVSDMDMGKTISVVITAKGYYTGTKSASINISENPYVPVAGIVEQNEGVTVDLAMGSTLLSEEQANQLMALNAAKPIVINGSGYTITFPKGSMDAESGWHRDLDMGLSFNSGAYYAAIKSETGDDFVLMLEFGHSGALPGEAQIKIHVGTQYAGQTLKYLYYNPQTKKLETMQTAVVDKNGDMTIKQDHCSAYAVTLYDADDSPETGDTGSSLLWWLLAGLSAAGILTIFIIWGMRIKVSGRK